MPNGFTESALLSRERFPYRDASPREVGEVVVANDRLIASIVRERLPDRHLQELDDLLQTCRLAVVTALPEFDARRGAKISTYVFRVCHRTLSRELPRLKRTHVTRPPDQMDREAPDPHDNSAWAEAIMAAPDRYLSKRQTQLFRLLMAGADMQTISKQLDLAPKEVSNLHYRLKIRIGELAGERAYHKG